MAVTTIYRTLPITGLIVMLGALFLTMRSDASTGDFYLSYTDVKVIAHLSLSGESPQRIWLQQDGGKQYLYLQQPSEQGFTIIDVTKPTKPRPVSHVSQGSLTTVGSGLAIVEQPDPRTTAASHIEGSPEGTRGGGAVSRLVRILDVSDPAHPRTVQSFSGVTSILPDDARGMIYVANSEGIWILSHQQVLRRHPCSSSDAISPIPNCD